MENGARIWVTDAKDGWAIATVNSKSGKEIKATLKSSGEEITRKLEEACSTMGSEPGSLKTIDDLTRLPALHEAALLQALQERFDSDQIYTWVGPILIAVNPFRKINNLYQTKRWIAQEKSLPPHVYGLVDAAYRAMVDFHGQNQSILVSGESGAGKTETTKHAMQYLTEVSGGSGASHVAAAAHDISSRILQANPLLEAFGNAKTVRNDNSSRFGKLIEMRFAHEGRHKLIGAGVTSYLLEKARIVHQARGERNYHIFYEMFAGGKSSKWKLTSPKGHRYLAGSGEFTRADVDDSEQFQKTLQAMETLGFTSQDCDAVFEIVAGVLHLGDVEFVEEKGGEACSVRNPEAVKAAAECLGIETGKCTDKSFIQPDQTLSDVLCVRKVSVQGLGGDDEMYVKTFSAQFAREARDALAMSIYERLFAWIVWRVNYSMQLHSSGKHAHEADDGERKFRIGILDIFGFEVFEDNYFEQLCINYANEQLQRQFNEHVFELEQKMYEKEGVDWTFVEFPDNSPTIAMIEGKPIGLFSLVDEECIYPSGGDRSLAAKLYQNLKTFDRFACPQTQQRDFCFTIKHFAGDVTYQVEGFYRKNKNELRQDAVDLICSSKKFLVRVLLPPDSQEAAGGADAAKYFEKRTKQLGAGILASPASSAAKEWETKPLPPWEKDTSNSHHRVKSSGRRSQIQQTTVSSHFKTQLHSALSLIRASKPSYVRCLKPNDRNKPNIYTRPRVLDQLRYSGVVEVIKVARAGYPTRFDLEHFVDRYAVLISVKNSNQRNAGLLEARRLIRAQDVRALTAASNSICLGAGLVQNNDFQVGKTKVFLRAEATSKLELAKGNKIKGAVRLIQRTWRHYYITHRAERAAKKIQRLFRGYLVRKKYKPVFQRRRAAADYIHSSPNMKRWVRQIRANLKAQGRGNGSKKKAALVGHKDYLAQDQEDAQQLWWLAVPLIILVAVPSLATSHPYMLVLLLLGCGGAAMGSFLAMDAQKRGLFLPPNGERATTAISKKSNALKKSASVALSQRKAKAAAFLPEAVTKPLAKAARNSNVEIKVNGEALKRFAGLAKKKEAMERARKRAEDMYLAGQLPVQANPKTSTVSVATTTAAAHKSSSTTATPTKTPSLPATAKPTPTKVPPPLPPAKPSPTAKKAAPPPPIPVGKPRADTTNLTEEEQYSLNKAILSMFLEEQAPDQVDMTDELLLEFAGKEETLFDKLTEEFPHVDALHNSATTDTPVWDKFIKRKSSRRKHGSRGSRGFFGTVGPSLEDEIRAVTDPEKPKVPSVAAAANAMKSRYSVAKSKTEAKAKQMFTKLANGM